MEKGLKISKPIDNFFLTLEDNLSGRRFKRF